MELAIQNVSVNIPKADLKFFRELAAKMGWVLNTRESLVQRYLKSRPTDVCLSDDDILAELKAVRYKK